MDSDKLSALPQAFLHRMEDMLGDEFEPFLAAYEQPRTYGLRVNTAKISCEEFEQIVPFEVKKIPWVSNGYFYNEDVRPSRCALYQAGLYYLQEPSAMTPASRIPVEPGEYVLDMCAAPGGKATAVGSALKGEGLLVANDISTTRARALLRNLELFGIPNLFVANEKPEKMVNNFPEFFHKIILDAPCSGEGMFRKEEALARDWTPEKSEELSRIQKQLCLNAADMLQPGGQMLYSTCTFSKKEDEENVAYILEKYPSMELVPIDKEQFKGLSDGFGYPQTARLFPHRIQGEGHFLALFHKKEDENGSGSGAAVLRLSGDEKEASKRAKEAGKQEDLMKFLKNCRKEWDLGRIYIRDEQVYYLPEGLKTGLPLRFLRTGLHLGELKKGRFEPSQAFAMALKKDEYPVRLDLKTEDERVIRYLKGETISLVNEEEPVKGWCLVTVEGFPLGWAKGNGMTLKNKYYAGWRWQ